MAAPDFEEASRSLFGALRLARGDRRGLDFIDRTPDGALRSFYGALLVLPIFAIIEAIQLSGRTVEAGALRILVVEALAYTIGWTAFQTVMIWLTALLQRQERYFDFLATYNWVTVVQMTVYFPVALLVGTGALPPGVVGALSWIVTLLLLTYTWFALKVTLDIPGGTAVGLVVVDLVLGVMLSGATDAALGVAPLG